ncbi:MAG TPA: recombinase family protein, partial [Gemmataceae bacterium]|nr:recombinase family protein [Gemmataceae bacterium]
MIGTLPTAGAAVEAVRRQAHREWQAAARQAGIDLTGFDPDAPFEHRVAWAVQAGLLVAALYARFSSKHQHSTADQVRANVEYAARHRMYVPPELINADEAAKGRRVRRDGLDRLRAILAARLAEVMLVFKASRLFRKAYEGYRLIQEEVVEEGLRAVSVSQGIDTTSRGWKAQIQLYGLMDESLLDTIADFVREGHVGLFKKGFTTGAVGIGLKRVEVPDARPTNRGLPRTRPAVDPPVADLIRRHAAWLLAGMPVVEGVRRWRRENGPADPRSTTGTMSRDAYVRLFTNPRLTGRLEYGRKRNQWSSKRDYTRQVVQPDGAVVTVHCEDLRVLPDDQFYALQRLFAGRKTGPRPPRDGKPPVLWNSVTDVFVCGRCGHRLYVGGAHGLGMRCPTPDCPNRAIVNRKAAVLAVCSKLTDLVRADGDLVDRAVAAVAALDAATPDDARGRIADLERKDRTLTRRVADLTDLSGEGTDADRAEIKAKIRAVQAERAGVRA